LLCRKKRKRKKESADVNAKLRQAILKKVSELKLNKPAQSLPSQTKFIQAAFSLLLYYYDVKINVKHGKVKMKMNANMYV